MTVDDGTTLDSRQPIDGDPSSQVTRSSLATSLLWWITVASVVSPILDSAGGDSFALVIGNRSVVELRQDGTLRRKSLRSFLPGGNTNTEIIRVTGETLPEGFDPVPDSPYAAVNSALGVGRGQAGRRWRFLNGNEFYLRYAGPVIAPAVIVDAGKSLMDGTEITGLHLEALQRSRLFGSSIVLVLPHTHRAEALIGAHHRRLADRWYGPSGIEPSGEWDSKAPPDPVRYTCPVPIRADFAVSGLSQGGSWQDPADLEAARWLLQARYDLKIGIWDLVRNPVLRRTLLQSIPVPEAPTGAATVPAAAARRANRHVAEIVDREAAARQALTEISTHLGALYEQGWQDQRPGDLRLPLTQEFSRWEDAEPEPLVWLRLTIARQCTEVTGFALLYNHPDVDIDDYVRARRDLLCRIAAPGEFAPNRAWPVLWRDAEGWAGDVDWQARADQIVSRTDQWIRVFDGLCAISLEIMAGKRPYP